MPFCIFINLLKLINNIHVSLLILYKAQNNLKCIPENAKYLFVLSIHMYLYMYVCNRPNVALIFKIYYF